VRQAVLEDVDLPEAAFEAVVAADVIEHLFDPVSAVRTLNDALTPGGALFVTVPDAGSVVARLLGPRWWSVMPMHVQYFSQTSMRRLLEDQGLEVVSIATHPKSFSARYYVDRLAAFQPVAGRLASAVLRRSGRANKLVAPDLRDRMAVIARKPDTS
jgi:SAM-dependent methyltransferase